MADDKDSASVVGSAIFRRPEPACRLLGFVQDYHGGVWLHEKEWMAGPFNVCQLVCLGKEVPCSTNDCAARGNGDEQADVSWLVAGEGPVYSVREGVTVYDGDFFVPWRAFHNAEEGFSAC